MRALVLGAVLAGCIPYVDFGPDCLNTNSCPDAGDAGDAARKDAAVEAGIDAPDADAGPDVTSEPAAEGGADVAAEDVGLDAEGEAGVDVAMEAAVEAAVDAPRELACGAGLRACGEACVNTLDDVSNCGACGRACRGDQACAGGACECAAGRVECGSACRNLQTDAMHCGRCGNACASGSCVAGACACAAGEAACDGACRNLQTDAMHCGRCGNACRSGACAAGACLAEQRSCRTAGTPGCGLVEVAGGTFTMGTPLECGAGVDPWLCAVNSTPAQGPVTIDAFAIDAYEVTVARFREFWLARAADGGASLRAAPVRYPGGREMPWFGEGQAPLPADVQCNFTTAAGAARGAHPINCLTWTTAMEFCVWDGGRLPTEAEWEFAARGRPVPSEGLTAGRGWPWGNEAPTGCARAHVGGCAGEDGALTRRVGRFAASGGIYDLAGNVDELMADRYELYTNTACWGRFGVSNPLCPPLSATDLRRTVRSGSWISTEVRSATRRLQGSNELLGYVGFRCARSR
ncbi:MAG: SUMF1/EgtB/PvdO family nonheme iron enzyme [Polyangiales bacterium]